MVSCKLYRLDSKAALQTLPPLLERLQKEKALTYARTERNPETELKVYYGRSKENELGQWHEFYVDNELVLWSRQRGEYSVPVTFWVGVQFFTGNFSPLVAVFGSRYNSIAFENALRLLSGPDATLFLSVELDLTQKSEEIRGHFADVQRFKVERLRDDKEKLASIGGMRLQSSAAWDRYLQKMHGALTMVVVKYKDVYVKISEDGMLRFRAQADDVRMVRDIISELRALGVMT